MYRYEPGAYLAELRKHRRSLAAASLGLASGYQLTNFLTNLFGPHLIHAFGWSKAQLSLGGAAALSTVLLGPVAGRITDAVGVRPMAAAGVISTPLVYLGYASMNGDIRLFVLIAVLQTVMMGLTTSSIVYARILAQEFTYARGAALAIAACAPALASILLARPLSAFMETHGWRAGYLALAILTGVGGAVTLMLIPRGSSRTLRAKPGANAALYREIGRNRTFWVIIFGLLLCNLPVMMQASQLGVLLQDHRAGTSSIAWIVALYAVAVILGRLVCGFCLDRWPTHIVVAINMSLPAVGLFILASSVTHVGILGGAVGMLGLAIGAEVSIMSFLVMRYFPVEIFSTVIGLVASVVALSAAGGALILSLTLQISGGFTLFLLMTGSASLIGGLSFLLLSHAERKSFVGRESRSGIPLYLSPEDAKLGG